MRILITGANGFVGRHLVGRCVAQGHQVSAVVRDPDIAAALSQDGTVDVLTIDDIVDQSGWGEMLQGVDVVVHLAARVHIMRETASDPLSSFRAVNVEGTRRLVEGAVAAGVRRFVLLSSIKVNGETTSATPFRADDAPQPLDAYAISKAESEQVVRQVTAGTSCDYVVVRPPLVYGQGVVGNMARLIRLVRRGVPLPFAAVANRRSLVSLDNLSDFLLLCFSHPAAADQVFLVADATPLSTPQLVRAIAHCMQRRANLLPVPPRLMRAVAAVLGAGPAMDRLLGSLEVDIGKNRHLLGWAPAHSADAALCDAVRAVLDQDER